MLVSFTSVQCAVAENAGSNVAAAGPDVSVIMKSLGYMKIGGANVYVDDQLAGTTDSNGNLTFKEAPAAGNHTVTVTKKGLQNATLTTDFSVKPIVVGMVPVKSYTMTLHVTDKNKNGLANVSFYNDKYLIGSTDETGNLTISDAPMCLSLIRLNKEGYKNSTSLLIVYTNKTQGYMLTPA